MASSVLFLLLSVRYLFLSGVFNSNRSLLNENKLSYFEMKVARKQQKKNVAFFVNISINPWKLLRPYCVWLCLFFFIWWFHLVHHLNIEYINWVTRRKCTENESNLICQTHRIFNRHTFFFTFFPLLSFMCRRSTMCKIQCVIRPSKRKCISNISMALSKLTHTHITSITCNRLCWARVSFVSFQYLHKICIFNSDCRCWLKLEKKKNCSILWEKKKYLLKFVCAIWRKKSTLCA